MATSSALSSARSGRKPPSGCLGRAESGRASAFGSSGRLSLAVALWDSTRVSSGPSAWRSGCPLGCSLGSARAARAGISASLARSRAREERLRRGPAGKQLGGGASPHRRSGSCWGPRSSVMCCAASPLSIDARKTSEKGATQSLAATADFRSAGGLESALGRAASTRSRRSRTLHQREDQ